MAKTIYQMAKEYADNRDELFHDEQQYCFEAYIEGANAVLKEIMDYISNRPFGTDDMRIKLALSCFEFDIYDKIRELKGEQL